jgi:N6-adenosine-specific RNA methylase IME4
MTDEKFESFIEDTKAVITAATIGDSAIVAAARKRIYEQKRAARAAKERELGARQCALPSAKYGVILADPEWKFPRWSEKGLTSAPENHYPTSEIEVIKARDVPSICAKDCVLFLWATVPMLPQCLEVMKAWGFDYASHFCWIKPKWATGYWNRNKHELLLIGTRGSIPAPAPGTQFASAFETPTGRHSEKPEIVHQMIDKMFPSLPRIELNARKRREGWDSWGNEVGGLEHGAE